MLPLDKHIFHLYILLNNAELTCDYHLPIELDILHNRNWDTCSFYAVQVLLSPMVSGWAVENYNNFANLISKLNFYKLIPYPMDNCFTGRRDRSRQTPEKDVLYNYRQDRSQSVHSPGGASYFISCLPIDVIASFSCLILVRPLVS